MSRKPFNILLEVKRQIDAMSPAQIQRELHKLQRGKAMLRDKVTMEAVKRNKFYVGSNSVFSRTWGHPTEADAVAHARRILENMNDGEFTFVVKILKVVKRAPRPTVVVDVR